MKEILVLGMGNRLMMDDGIGVYVVEELQKRNTNHGIRYVIGETDIYFCLNQIEKASYIVIVDAACLDKEPGAIRTIQIGRFLKKSIQPIAVHDSHLLDEIKLRGKGIEGVFIGIEPQEVNYGLNLSKCLQEHFLKVVDKIESIIVSLTAEKQLPREYTKL